jgi:hypothetical protein
MGVERGAVGIEAENRTDPLQNKCPERNATPSTRMPYVVGERTNTAGNI